MISDASDSCRRKFSLNDSLVVKGVAIIIMLFHHCFLAPERYVGQSVNFAPFSEQQLNAVALAGKICVALFTFISAYGITYSYKKTSSSYSLTPRQWTASIVRRTLKIESGFLFIFVFVHMWSLLIMHENGFIRYGSGIKSILYCAIDACGLAEFFGTPTLIPTFWYISLAYMIIVFVPLFLFIYRKWGIPTLLLLATCIKIFFPYTKDAHFTYFPDYAFCACCGIIAADRNIIGRCSTWLHSIKRLRSTIITIVMVLAFVVLMLCRQRTLNTALLPIWDGLIPLLLIIIIKNTVGKIAILVKCLSVLGKHSRSVENLSATLQGEMQQLQ